MLAVADCDQLPGHHRQWRRARAGIRSHRHRQRRRLRAGRGPRAPGKHRAGLPSPSMRQEVARASRAISASTRIRIMSSKRCSTAIPRRESGNDHDDPEGDRLTSWTSHIVGQGRNAKKRGRHRAAQPLAPPAGRRAALRHEMTPKNILMIGPDRRRQDRDRAPPRQAGRRALHQGRGDQVHRSRLCRPRCRHDRARPGRDRHQAGHANLSHARRPGTRAEDMRQRTGSSTSLLPPGPWQYARCEFGLTPSSPPERSPMTMPRPEIPQEAARGRSSTTRRSTLELSPMRPAWSRS